MLGMQKRNFNKTAIWILIVHNCWKPMLPRKNFPNFFFSVLEADWKSFLKPLPLLKYFAETKLSWIQREFGKKLKSLLKVVYDWDGIFTLIFIACCISLFGGWKILREQAFEQAMAKWDFLFAVWIFVSELALFYRSNVQLIKDVCKHRFRCLFKEQRYFLNDWGDFSEAFTVLQVVVGLLNICTENVFSVRKPETHFWYALAAEWLFKKHLLKLTWN